MKYGTGLRLRSSNCRRISRFGVKLIVSDNPRFKKKQTSKNRKRKKFEKIKAQVLQKMGLQ